MIHNTYTFVSTKISRYLPEFVYGSIDGVVTTFAIIAGIAGAKLDTSIVIILGFSNVLADGFSMASSNYLSEQAHKDQLEQNASQTPTSSSPFKTALATFLSFVAVGSIPITAYIIASIIPSLANYAFLFAGIWTGLTFIGIGAIRGIITEKSPIRTACETLAIGVVAALVAYSVGAIIEKMIR